MSQMAAYRMSIQESEQYRRGWRAFDNRLERADCPYAFNTHDAYAWQTGWDDAEDHATSWRNP